MGLFSSIDLETRMEVQDLLSRFCHSLDFDKVEEWRELFRRDASVTAPRFGRFCGIDQICQIPGLVARAGNGKWRHVFNNVVLSRSSLRVLSVAAYCVVNDWAGSGGAVRCWDFTAIVEKQKRWLIHDLEMRSVRSSSNRSPVQAADPIEMP